MLQRNAPQGRHAHIAHAALIGLHAICCGLPALAMLAAAASGAASSLALLSGSVGIFHDFLHAHEVWIVALSAALVAIGGALELNARRGANRHGFPWLFAFSAFCFALNLGIVLIHRA